MAKRGTNGTNGFFDATKVWGDFGLSAVNFEATREAGFLATP